MVESFKQLRSGPVCEAMNNWLTNNDGPRAIFNIVFALAANKPSVAFQVVPLPEEPTVLDVPTVAERQYNIWCAGLSPSVLPQVLAEQQGAWDAILRASNPWENIFLQGDGKEIRNREHMNPGAADVAGFYEKFYRVDKARSKPGDERIKKWRGKSSKSK